MGASNTDLAALVRAVIERQVATTAAGKALTALNADAVRQLVTNLVGNVATVVEYEIENALAGEQAVAA